MESSARNRRRSNGSSSFPQISTLATALGLAIAISALTIASIVLVKFNNRDIIKIVNGLQNTLGISFGLSASDVIVIVPGCTNDTISPTNEEFSDGSFLWAHRCSEITDRQCVTNICNGNGVCEEITTPGMECSLTEQCEEAFGPGYVCNTTLCVCEVMVPVNGSMYTNSLVCDNNGTMGVVMVMEAQCPTPGQLLTAIDSSSANWQDPPTVELPCDSGIVVISNSTCPTTGDILVATSSGTASWSPPPSSSDLLCDSGSVVISNATCPTTGQVLTAISSGIATWQDPVPAPAQELECDGGSVVISNATCPTAGDVLVATSSGIATWGPPYTIIEQGTMQAISFLDYFGIDYVYVGSGNWRMLQWYRNVTLDCGPGSILLYLTPTLSADLPLGIGGATSAVEGAATRVVFFNKGFLFGDVLDFKPPSGGFSGAPSCGLRDGSVSWFIEP